MPAIRTERHVNGEMVGFSEPLQTREVRIGDQVIDMTWATEAQVDARIARLTAFLSASRTAILASESVKGPVLRRDRLRSLSDVQDQASPLLDGRSVLVVFLPEAASPNAPAGQSPGFRRGWWSSIHSGLSKLARLACVISVAGVATASDDAGGAAVNAVASSSLAGAP